MLRTLCSQAASYRICSGARPDFSSHNAPQVHVHAWELRTSVPHTQMITDSKYKDVIHAHAVMRKFQSITKPLVICVFCFVFVFFAYSVLFADQPTLTVYFFWAWWLFWICLPVFNKLLSCTCILTTSLSQTARLWQFCSLVMWLPKMKSLL